VILATAAVDIWPTYMWRKANYWRMVRIKRVYE